MPQPVWTFQNSNGLWAIARGSEGRWHPMLGNDALGSYYSAEAALDDLVGGHTFRPPSGLDPSTCELPEDLSNWSKRQG